MGFDDRFEPRGTSAVNGTGPAVGVFVSSEQADVIARQAQAGHRVMMLVAKIGLSDPVPTNATASLAAAVIEVNPAERKSVDRLVQMVRKNPQLSVIAAIASPDVALVRTLVREGVADVIGLPIDLDELTTAALDALARKALPTVQTALAPLIGVVRSSGGCGATTVATHLAAELGKRDWGGRGALIGDLDLQFGSVAAYLDVNRSGSLPDLMAARDRMDAFLIHSIATETGDGLAVLAVPEEIVPMDSVSIDALIAVVEELRRHYGLVVLDFPADWPNWSASLAYSADLLLIVVELSLNSIRQAQRCLGLFHALGIPPERAEIVVNKVERKLFRPINLKDIGQTLNKEILASLPADGDALRRAQDQGVLVDVVARRSQFAAAIRKLADSVEERLKAKGQI